MLIKHNAWCATDHIQIRERALFSYHQMSLSGMPIFCWMAEIRQISDSIGGSLKLLTGNGNSPSSLPQNVQPGTGRRAAFLSVCSEVCLRLEVEVSFSVRKFIVEKKKWVDCNGLRSEYSYSSSAGVARCLTTPLAQGTSDHSSCASP